MIRLAKEADAEAIMNIRKEIILSENTTKFFIVSPKKLPNDIDAEREKIRKSNEKGNLYIVYEVDYKVVGFLLFNRYELERLQHAGTMGMGIKEAYCNQGIGTKLIEFLISWAKGQKGLEKICFRCLPSSTKPIRLYTLIARSLTETTPKQIKYEDGSYGDDVLMGFYIK